MSKQRELRDREDARHSRRTVLVLGIVIGLIATVVINLFLLIRSGFHEAPVVQVREDDQVPVPVPVFDYRTIQAVPTPAVEKQ